MRATVRPERPFALLLILFALTAAGCARTHGQKEAKYLENGKRYMVGKDYARAALQFHNAVQVAPRDPEAYYQLGLAYLADGNLTEAVRYLKNATELNPGHAGAQVKLAELMALSGVKDVVQEGEKRMQDVLRASPENVDAIDALALNEFQLGKWQDAEKHLQEALDKFPQSVKSSVALARLHLARRDLKGAEEVLQKAAQEVPKSMEAATGLGELYLLAGRWNEAEGQFRNALKINPQFALALFGLASAQIRQGYNDQAEQTYQTISALPEKQYTHLHAAYLFEEGKRDLAVKEFEDLTRKDPSDRAARTRLVAAYVMTNRVQDAEKILNAALKSDSKDVDAVLQRSEILLRSGKHMEAESYLIQVLHQQPDSVQGHYLLAEVYETRGETLLQRQELDEALRRAPAFLVARIRLAQAMVAANSAKAALNVLDATPTEQKGTLAFVIQRNWVLLALNDQAEARQGVSRGLTVVRAPDLLLQDSILKLAQRDYAGARSSVQEALQQNPEDWRGLRVMAASYVGQKQPAAAVRVLQEYSAQHPKSAPIQQFLGEWLLAAGEPVQARVAFTAARADDPSSKAANLALARLDIAEGKLDAARNTLTNILVLNAEYLEARQWLGSVEVRSGNYTAAIEQFRKVLEEDAKNVLALNNLAYLLANYTDRVDEAIGYAQQALELAPDNADTEGTLGWVLYRKGIYSMALKHLQDAAAKDGDSSTQNAAIRKYHLAMSYLKLGDWQSGKKALDAAQKINPNLPEAKMAEVVLRQGGDSTNNPKGRHGRPRTRPLRAVRSSA